MSMNWVENDTEDLVKRFSEDRGELLRRLSLLHPVLASARPSKTVETVITDVCGFHVVDEPLCLGQLALCDFSIKTVIVNSRMHEFVHHRTSRELLRRSTLAHELGHIRLHREEIAQGCTLHYLNESGQFADSRSYQKEREADLYAAIFLVPLEELLNERSIQNLLRCKKDGRPMGSGTLWNIVYRQASAFEVSPALMKRCFLELGWIRQEGRRRGASGLHKLALRY